MCFASYFVPAVVLGVAMGPGRGTLISLSLNSSLQISNKDPEEEFILNVQIKKKHQRFTVFQFLSCDLLVFNVTLLQDGVHHIEVHGRHTDVHIDVDSHQLRGLGSPEVDLQMAAKSNTWAYWNVQM